MWGRRAARPPPRRSSVMSSCRPPLLSRLDCGRCRLLGIHSLEGAKPKTSFQLQVAVVHDPERLWFEDGRSPRAVRLFLDHDRLADAELFDRVGGDDELVP